MCLQGLYGLVDGELWFYVFIMLPLTILCVYAKTKTYADIPDTSSNPPVHIPSGIYHSTSTTYVITAVTHTLFFEKLHMLDQQPLEQVHDALLPERRKTLCIASPTFLSV